MGRQKIEIKKNNRKSSLNTTFSKRRAGLFKKANELCILCGAEIAIIVFSPGGVKVFSFGHPSMETVLGKFLITKDGAPVPEVANGTVLSLLDAHCELNH
ncbi:hypothetical protein NE237_022666 [Protea cynaroides]|uniref:MADS-box domain-containing protein n=1 Tax=Protea cynaroides TaxID=273540 RepID=A0A9Q0HEU3_9MAGN|nr:hypothetical protein NE237_022666 [Protea cynaroides]